MVDCQSKAPGGHLDGLCMALATHRSQALRVTVLYALAAGLRHYAQGFCRSYSAWTTSILPGIWDKKNSDIVPHGVMVGYQ
jgi:hypothetical protein